MRPRLPALRPASLAALTALLMAWSVLPALAAAEPAATNATAQPPVDDLKAAPWQAEWGSARDSLGAGRPAWTENSLYLRRPPAAAPGLEFSFRTLERNALSDRSFGAQWISPLGGAWSNRFTADYSPTRRNLAQWALGTEAQYQTGNAWVLGLSGRLARYTNARATTLGLSADRYLNGAEWGEWRLGLGLSQVQLAGTGYSVQGQTLRLQLDRFLGERGRLGLRWSRGDDLDGSRLGQERVPGSSAWVLMLKWPLATDWAILFDWHREEVGTLYQRRGGRLGVQHDF